MKFFGPVRYHGVLWSFNSGPNTVPRQSKCAANAGGVGRINAPRFVCSKQNKIKESIINKKKLYLGLPIPTDLDLMFSQYFSTKDCNCCNSVNDYDSVAYVDVDGNPCNPYLKPGEKGYTKFCALDAGGSPCTPKIFLKPGTPEYENSTCVPSNWRVCARGVNLKNPCKVEFCCSGFPKNKPTGSGPIKAWSEYAKQNGCKTKWLWNIIFK